MRGVVPNKEVFIKSLNASRVREHDGLIGSHTNSQAMNVSVINAITSI